MKEPSAPRVSTRSAAFAAASKVENLDMQVLKLLGIHKSDIFGIYQVISEPYLGSLDTI